jgi:hypothetical protein
MKPPGAEIKHISCAIVRHIQGRKSTVGILSFQFFSHKLCEGEEVCEGEALSFCS